MVVFEQPGSDQQYGGRILLGVSECAAGAVLPRTGEHAVQHGGRGEIEWPPVLRPRSLLSFQALDATPVRLI